MARPAVSALDSAGAPSAASTGRRVYGGVVVTAAMLGGTDPNSLSADELEDRMCDLAMADAG